MERLGFRCVVLFLAVSVVAAVSMILFSACQAGSATTLTCWRNALDRVDNMQAWGASVELLLIITCSVCLWMKVLERYKL